MNVGKELIEISNILEAALSDVPVKEGKMHKLLGIPEDKEVSEVYTSGKKLAEDLVRSLNGDKKKASGMLAFAANINKEDNVFDKALRSLSTVASDDYSERIKKAFDNAMMNYNLYNSYPYLDKGEKEKGYKAWIKYANSHKELLSDLAMHPLSSICLKIVQQS